METVRRGASIMILPFGRVERSFDVSFACRNFHFFLFPPISDLSSAGGRGTEKRGWVIKKKEKEKWGGVGLPVRQRQQPVATVCPDSGQRKRLAQLRRRVTGNYWRAAVVD